MPTLYSYSRVSTLDQKKELPQQDRVVKERIDRELDSNPGLNVGKHFTEKQSAFKKSFRLRTAGQALDAVVKRGDTVIFARADRAFRMGQDFENMLFDWRQLGVKIIFCDVDCDTSTASGEHFLRGLVAGAQYLSHSISERVKLAYVENCLHGGAPPSNCGVFVKAVVRGSKRYAMLNKRTIAVLRFASARRRRAFILNQNPPGMVRLSDEIEALLAKHEKREPELRCNRQWGARMLREAMETMPLQRHPAILSRWCTIQLRPQPLATDCGRINPYTLRPWVVTS